MASFEPGAPRLSPEVVSPERRRWLIGAAASACLGGLVGAAAVLSATLTLLASAGHEPAPTPAAIGVALPAVEPMPAPEPIEPARFGRALFVAHAPGPMAVLDSEVDEHWYAGEPRLVEGEDFEITLVRDLDPERIPRRYRDAVGGEVLAVDRSGALCRARLGSLRAVGAYVDDHDGAPGDAEAIRSAWNYTAPFLAADLALADDEDCGELAWIMLPDPTVDPRTAPSPAAVESGEAIEGSAIEAQALVAFRGLAAYRAHQRAWEAGDGRGPWTGSDGVEVNALRTEGGGVVIASAEVGGCGAFEATLTAAWRIEDGRLGAPLELAPLGFVYRIEGGADVNGDGLPELLIREGRGSTAVLHSESGRQYLRSEGPRTQNHMCPC